MQAFIVKVVTPDEEEHIYHTIAECSLDAHAEAVDKFGVSKVSVTPVSKFCVDCGI